MKQTKSGHCEQCGRDEEEIMIFVFSAEISLKPRFDFTREGKILLWYGRYFRKYIVIN